MSQELPLKEKLKTVQEMSLKEILLLMASSLRNNQGITQCRNDLWKGDNRFCAYGLLGFRSGIPKEDLPYKHHKKIYERILDNYGLTEGERFISIKALHYQPDFKLRYLFFKNDEGYTVDQIADCLEYTANNL